MHYYYQKFRIFHFFLVEGFFVDLSQSLSSIIPFYSTFDFFELLVVGYFDEIFTRLRWLWSYYKVLKVRWFVVLRFFRIIFGGGILLINYIIYCQMMRGLRILQRQRIFLLQYFDSLLEEHRCGFFLDLEEVFAVFILNNVVWIWILLR